jgi:hypothetical protein
MIALLALVFTADYFLSETLALGWHLRHGFHAEMNGIKFKVPVLYREDHEPKLLEISFSTMPGRYNRKMAVLTVDFHKQPPAAQDPERGARLVRLGVKESAPRPVRMAGHDGTCVEQSPLYQEDTGRMLKGNYTIRCSFADDLYVSFWGTQNAVPDFYTIVQSAEAVKGNI